MIRINLFVSLIFFINLSAYSQTFDICSKTKNYSALDQHLWKNINKYDQVSLAINEKELKETLTLNVNLVHKHKDYQSIGGTISGHKNGHFHFTWSKDGFDARFDFPELDKVIAYHKVKDQAIKKNDPCKFSESFCKMPNAPVNASDEAAQLANVDLNSAPVSSVPILNSYSGVGRKVIYLDFDGETVSGTIWNTNYNNGQDIIAGPYDIDGNPHTFNATEVSRITQAWKEVAQDFSGFTVNVTTSEQAYLNAYQYSRIRVIITPTSHFLPNAGGVAYLNSFRWTGDTPVWVWNQTLHSMGVTISHEVGHALNLRHDGTPTTTYYGGHYTGDNLTWSPIMGANFSQGLKQWSKGEYANANNLEDDLSIMTNFYYYDAYTLGYFPDRIGNDIHNSGSLQRLYPVTDLSLKPVSHLDRITTNTDIDVYSIFPKASGILELNIDGENHSNIDIQAELVDETGQVLTTNNPPGDLNAFISHPVATDTQYYLRVQSVGKNNPSAANGYSNYAGIGDYTVSGNIPYTFYPPTVNITSPLDGDTFELNDNIQMLIQSGDSDGIIGTATVYKNNEQIFINPFPITEYNFTAETAGPAELSVEVFDSDGLRTTSDPVNILIIGDPKLRTDTEELSFDYVQVGQTAQRTITLSNEGFDTTTISSMSFLNSSNWSVSPNSLSIASGDSAEIRISFHPQAQNSNDYQTSLQINSNAIDNPLITLALQGLGGETEQDLNISQTFYADEVWNGSAYRNINLNQVNMNPSSQLKLKAGKRIIINGTFTCLKGAKFSAKIVSPAPVRSELIQETAGT